MKVTIYEYMKKVIENDLISEFDWAAGCFGLIDEKIKNKYISIIDNKYFCYIGDDEYEITDRKDLTRPLLIPTDKINLKAGDLPNLKEDIETTIGRLVSNYIILVKPFGNKINYINKQFTPEDVEDILAIRLVDENDNSNPDGIKISEYNNFVNATNYLQGWSELVVWAATPKGILPPPGIDEYKKKVIKELKEKYGENAMENFAVVAELDQRLKEYDKKYLEGDPSLGVTLSGKVLNNARKKMFLSFGADMGFNPDDKPVYVENSLQDGYPDDPKELTAMFNASRIASFSRGAETQKGGEDAKIILRATNAFEVITKDCGDTVGKPMVVTKALTKQLIGRSHIVNGRPVLIKTDKDLESYIGKTIYLRSPQFCKIPGDKYCSVCGGERLKDNPNGVSLNVISIGSVILTASLKMMHNSTISTARLNLKEAMS